MYYILLHIHGILFSIFPVVFFFRSFCSLIANNNNVKNRCLKGKTSLFMRQKYGAVMQSLLHTSPSSHITHVPAHDFLQFPFGFFFCSVFLEHTQAHMWHGIYILYTTTSSHRSMCICLFFLCVPAEMVFVCV